MPLSTTSDVEAKVLFRTLIVQGAPLHMHVFLAFELEERQERESRALTM